MPDYVLWLTPPSTEQGWWLNSGRWRASEGWSGQNPIEHIWKQLQSRLQACRVPLGTATHPSVEYPKPHLQQAQVVHVRGGDTDDSMQNVVFLFMTCLMHLLNHDICVYFTVWTYSFDLLQNVQQLLNWKKPSFLFWVQLHALIPHKVTHPVHHHHDHCFTAGNNVSDAHLVHFDFR